MEDYRSKDQKQQRFDKITGGSGGSDRNRTNDLSSFVFGKVQPQALQLEEAVLGALMLDKDGYQLLWIFYVLKVSTQKRIRQSIKQLRNFSEGQNRLTY